MWSKNPIPCSQLFQAPWNLPVDRVRSSDAAIVIYSIVDRLSFHSAREALDVMATLTPSVEIPVLLLANKTDLNHLRKVWWPFIEPNWTMHNLFQILTISLEL